MVREQVMEGIDNICDDELEGIVSDRLVTRLCDMVCEVMDAVGLE